jgi:hypothetical protein
VDLTEEHIVPQRWGGRLTTRSCGDCNGLGAKLERLAEEVPWVAAAVGRAGVRGRSGSLRRPQTKAHYPDGVYGVVAYTREGPTPAGFAPRLLGEDKDGKQIWEVHATQLDKFRKRAERRGQEFELRSRRAETYEGAEVEYGLGPANVSLWPRLAAKMALGCASLAFDAAWLERDGARRLQALFAHDRPPGFELGVLPTELHQKDSLYDLLEPGEHLLLFQPRPEGGAIFAVILFGVVQYVLRVPEANARDRLTWLLTTNEPAARTPEAFDAVFARLVLRAQERAPSERRAEG